MNYKRILVWAAHPDDELTMAGTIGMLRTQGTEVYIAMLMTGSEGFPRPEFKGRIVEMRRREADACDKVLGVKHRYHLGIPDMIGDGYTPERIKECIRIVREVRPDASFTHGPADSHNDHRLTHRLSIDALWHAAEPGSADLGAPWKTPFSYYYKGVAGGLPRVTVDVTAYAFKRFEALATQESQFVFFKTDRERILAEGRALVASGKPIRESFWLAKCNIFNGFLNVNSGN